MLRYLRFMCWSSEVLHLLLLQGRNPFFLEPAIIIAITDGNKLTSGSGVQDEVGRWQRIRREVFIRAFHDESYLTLSSSTCPWPLRCQVASWPRSPSAGTSVCSHSSCVLPVTHRSNLSPLVASRRMTLRSPPCVRSLEVGGLILYFLHNLDIGWRILLSRSWLVYDFL